MSDPRRLVPRTDAVLADPRLVAAAERLGRDRVKQVVVDAAGACPQRTDHAPTRSPTRPSPRCPRDASSLQPVLNATGVVLHTNLGRAPLSASARDALAAASGYVDVEYDTSQRTARARGRGALAALRRAVPRRRRGADRQQRRGRARAGDDCARRRTRGDHQPRRDGRDRRRLPAARPDRLDGCAAARGRDDQPGHAGRLRRRDQRRHRVHPQGASEQLPHRGLHALGRDPRPGRPARAGARRCRQRPARAAPAAA